METLSPAQFLAHYDREKFNTRRLSPDLEDALAPADEWGRYFGTVLFDFLAFDDESDCSTSFPNMVPEYHDWVTANLTQDGRIIKKIQDASLPLDEKLEGFGRIQFHRLNSAMLSQWSMEYYRNTDDEEYQRRLYTTQAQDVLAITAVDDYISKERSASGRNSYDYFDSSRAEYRATVEGTLNEIDAAIMLLEIARKQRLTILPAPPQFERGINPRSNADFIVIGKDRQAVGVQVKSTLTDTKADRYDDHIVLIDARVDMGNEIARRTELRSSTIKRLGWAGIIAAQRLSNMSLKKVRDNYRHDNVQRMSVLRSRHLAGKMVHGLRDELPAAVDRFSPRLMARFNVPLA